MKSRRKSRIENRFRKVFTAWQGWEREDVGVLCEEALEGLDLEVVGELADVGEEGGVGGVEGEEAFGFGEDAKDVADEGGIAKGGEVGGEG